MAEANAASTGWMLRTSSLADEVRLERATNRLVIHVGAHWVCMTAGEADEAPRPERRGPALVASARAYLSKYAIDRRGRLRKQVEIPQVGLRAEDLHAAIASLADANLTLVPPEPDAGAPPSTGDGSLVPVDAAVQLFRTLHGEGWDLKEEPRGNHWHAVYKGGERQFSAHVLLNPWWVSMQVPILPPAEAGRGYVSVSSALASYLLQMNDSMYWAKFGLTRTGQVLLMLDLAFGCLDVVRLRLAARTLARYLAETTYEVQILADIDRETLIQAEIRPLSLPATAVASDQRA